jgi:hypothetical protein
MSEQVVFLPESRTGTVSYWGKDDVDHVRFIGYVSGENEWMYLDDEGNVRRAITELCRISPVGERDFGEVPA